jgi:hypothetical protein
MSIWHNIDYFDTKSDLDLTERTTRLVTLNITTHKTFNYYSIEQLIKSCKTSLKNIILNVHSIHSIDGYRLEEVFKSCEQLKNFVFLFELNNKKININDCQRSFQSEWWLDARRPAVYIQDNDVDGIIITSMPCQYLFTFKNHLSNWYFNKGDQNSSFNRFNNINNIHFTNNVYQPISLEYLYSIDRIFTSSNQSLCFDFCDLKSVKILSYMVKIFFIPDNDLSLNLL